MPALLFRVLSSHTTGFHGYIYVTCKNVHHKSRNLNLPFSTMFQYAIAISKSKEKKIQTWTNRADSIQCSTPSVRRFNFESWNKQLRSHGTLCIYPYKHIKNTQLLHSQGTFLMPVSWKKWCTHLSAAETLRQNISKPPKRYASSKSFGLVGGVLAVIDRTTTVSPVL